MKAFEGKWVLDSAYKLSLLIVVVTRQTGVVAVISTAVREVYGSNFGRVSGYSGHMFRGFSRVSPGEYQDSTLKEVTTA